MLQALDLYPALWFVTIVMFTITILFVWTCSIDNACHMRIAYWREVHRSPQYCNPNPSATSATNDNYPSKIKLVSYSMFLAATKQLYEWYFLSVCLSVRPSVCPSHLFDYVPIIVSSWNFQELSPPTRVTSMQKIKVRGQRSRSQRSQPNLAVSGL